SAGRSRDARLAALRGDAARHSARLAAGAQRLQGAARAVPPIRLRSPGEQLLEPRRDVGGRARPRDPPRDTTIAPAPALLWQRAQRGHLRSVAGAQQRVAVLIQVKLNEAHPAQLLI